MKTEEDIFGNKIIDGYKFEDQGSNIYHVFEDHGDCWVFIGRAFGRNPQDAFKKMEKFKYC